MRGRTLRAGIDPGEVSDLSKSLDLEFVILFVKGTFKLNEPKSRAKCKKLNAWQASLNRNTLASQDQPDSENGGAQENEDLRAERAGELRKWETSENCRVQEIGALRGPKNSEGGETWRAKRSMNLRSW